MVTKFLNGAVQFNIRHENDIIYLDIVMYPCIDTSMVTKVTINCVNDSDLTKMVLELQKAREKVLNIQDGRK